MTSRVPFYFVDVFATGPLTGNPLSLVPDADGLDEAQMRAIAREFNQSETTFLLRPSLPGATVRLRSVTPAGAEVGGAGHNALGAWLWMAAAGRLASPAAGRGLRQEIAGQVLPVEVVCEAGHPAVVWMDQSPPHFGAVAGDIARLAGCLGLGERDLLLEEDAQVVSTGAGHLLVPARDRGAVDRAAPDAPRLVPALRQVGAEGLTCTARPGGCRRCCRVCEVLQPCGRHHRRPRDRNRCRAARREARRRGQGPRPVHGHDRVRSRTGTAHQDCCSVSGPRVRVGGSGLVVAEGTLTV